MRKSRLFQRVGQITIEYILLVMAVILVIFAIVSNKQGPLALGVNQALMSPVPLLDQSKIKMAP